MKRFDYLRGFLQEGMASMEPERRHGFPARMGMGVGIMTLAGFFDGWTRLAVIVVLMTLGLSYLFWRDPEIGTRVRRWFRR
ncbi:MAG: hypothetical protein P8011_06085 [Acidihalobacter sp.]|uniref:hypothetical protein n=1 Tax=Acidihalobacter sp. TaxID=1872108 RepID=UPI00307E58F0